MRTQNKPFVVEIKKAKRAIDAPAESPAPRGAAASPSIWNSMPEPSQPPLTASAARRAADALFDFKPKTAQPATPVERETPVVRGDTDCGSAAGEPLNALAKGPCALGRAPRTSVAAVDEVLMSFRPVGVADGHARIGTLRSRSTGREAPACRKARCASRRTPPPCRRACRGRAGSRRRPRVGAGGSPADGSSRPFPCSAPCAASGRRNCRVANAGRTAFPSSAAETSLRRKAEPTWNVSKSLSPR